MLRITQSNSASGAVKYFDEGLSKADYYQDKEFTIGKWNGKGRKILRLDEKVNRHDFASLAYNKHPETGEQLTPRMNENRRVGYDFTFSVPKSVSILNSLTDDRNIKLAFDKAVTLTMKELEKEAETRVRINGANENRVTGNLIWASFTHDEARPINGIPDPHLHKHVFVFNSTYDKTEARWKAIDIAEVKASAPFYEAMFHNHLANEMKNMGYSIDRNSRDFEIAGFDRNLIEKYSNRTTQINEKAKELGIESDKGKSELAARNREGKRNVFSPFEVDMRLKSRLSEREKEIVFGAKNSSDGIIDRVKSILQEKDKPKQFYSAEEVIELAIDHNLERKSVTTKKEVLQHAFRLGNGSSSVKEIKKALENKEDLIRGVDSYGREVITTENALNEEKKLIRSAKGGKNKFKPINPSYEPKNKELTDEQKHGVQHFLKSKDSITIISGGAGVGKTWSIKEVKTALDQKDIPFRAFAPSAAASRDVQRKEGFEGATTIAELLTNTKLHSSIKDGVMWIDESGLVGIKTMNAVIDLAEKQNARILLTGDIKQHNSVERGDAQRIIQEYGHIKPAYIKSIKRQKNLEYRSVVKDISEGNIYQAFDKLNKMGAINEHKDTETLRQKVAVEYAEAVKKKESALVIATTHAQGKAVTKSIRERLKLEGVLKGKDIEFTTHENLGFTQVEKQDYASYKSGLTIEFHQNIKGQGGQSQINRGSKFDVIKAEDGKVYLQNTSGAKHALDLSKKIKFSVYSKKQIGLTKNDKIRITQNGYDISKKRLNNGDVLTVTGINKKGNILAKTSGKREIILPKDFANFTHAYYTTSPSSQAKSINRVIIVQDSSSGKASSKEQFYVSASRGKISISIHTDDKEGLLYNIQKSTHRQAALELSAQNRNPHIEKLKRISRIYKTTKASVNNLGMAIKNKMTANPPVTKTPTHGRKGR